MRTAQIEERKEKEKEGKEKEEEERHLTYTREMPLHPHLKPQGPLQSTRSLSLPKYFSGSWRKSSNDTCVLVPGQWQRLSPDTEKSKRGFQMQTVQPHSIVGLVLNIRI